MCIRPLHFLPIFFFLLLISSCSRHPEHRSQGYIEGRYTYMATPVSGVLKQLPVTRGTLVKQGDMVFMLEPQPEMDAYDAAVSNLKQATAARDAIAANLSYAKITYERYKVLVPSHAIQQASLDNAKATFSATQAQLSQADANIASINAALAQAQWTKEQKIGYAPETAIVFDIYYRLGEYTEANHPIVSLLAPANIKAIFYLSEKDLGAIRLGDKISVRCNGCQQVYWGKISFISPSAEYTPPIIYSEQTNEKLIYRIEAEFAPDVAYHLHPGQPITVTYYPHE